jgi:DNA-binding MarR family transcriptional regulator
MATALRTAISGLHKVLRKQVYTGHSYSMTEMGTIGQLYRNPALLPTELAGLTMVKTQTMSQILNKLEQNGIISKTSSEKDKRKVLVSLTPAGRKMVEKTRYDRDEVLKGAIDRSLTEKEKELLAKALPVLDKLIEFQY